MNQLIHNQMPNNSDMLCPSEAIIKDIIDENSTIKTFVVELTEPKQAKAFSYMPGQFVMVSVAHQGEAPISISSSPTQSGPFHLSIRKAGRLTSVMHNMAVGDFIGIRGPYGRSFPMKELENRDLLIVAGGIGLAPMRSVINYCVDNSSRYNSLTLLYGSRTPSDIAFKKDLAKWEKHPLVDVRLTVDMAEPGWNGNVGLVTSLLEDVEIDNKTHSALLCGPPIMIDAVSQILQNKGLEPKNIITTLERNMKCGIGLCGHCYMNGVYICKKGPVFTLEQLNQLDKI